MKTKVVALKYDKTKNSAPEIIAKGENLFADQLIEAAKKNNIPIYEDKILLDYLLRLDVHQEIPQELYEFVVTVFMKIYELDKEYIA